MKNPIRQFFIPTDENGKLPYALHPAAFAVYLIFAVAFLIGPAYANRVQLANLTTPYRAYSVVELVNAARKAAGLPELKENPVLDQVAADKARDIFAKQYFAHISPDQKTPWDFLRARDYIYKAAGENLAIDYTTPEDAQEGFMASPTHRSNILNTLYTEMGAAVYEGTFENRPSIVVVQYFGTPRSVAPKSTVTAAAKPAPAKSAPKPPANVLGAEANLFANASSAEPELPTTTISVVSLSDTGEMIREEVSAIIPRSVEKAKEQSFPYIPVVSLFLLSGILLSGTFVVTRKEVFPAEVAMRAFLFLIVFGYIAIVGGATTLMPKLTPAAFSIIR